MFVENDEKEKKPKNESLEKPKKESAEVQHTEVSEIKEPKTVPGIQFNKFIRTRSVSDNIKTKKPEIKIFKTKKVDDLFIDDIDI